MNRSALRVVWLVAFILLSSALGGRTVEVVNVKGSDTVGGTLGPALARAFMVRNSGIQVEWEALGSGTAFVGLFDGPADLGAASRSVRPSELEEARRFGIRLREWVLGYDGLAILVHPANGVARLSQAQLRSLFSGEVLNWRDVGGPDLSVQPVVRPPYSGTYGLFRDEVLRGDGVDRDFAADAAEFEHSEQAINFVSRQRGAVAFLGMGWVQPGVRAVPIVGQAGDAVLPQLATVRAGAYALFRPLFLYSRGVPAGASRTLLQFLLGPDGQRIVEDNGFIAADTQLALSQLEGSDRPAGRRDRPADLCPWRCSCEPGDAFTGRGAGATHPDRGCESSLDRSRRQPRRRSCESTPLSSACSGGGGSLGGRGRAQVFDRSRGAGRHAAGFEQRLGGRTHGEPTR